MAQIKPFSALRAGSRNAESFSVSAYDSGLSEEPGQVYTSNESSYLEILSPGYFLGETQSQEESHRLSLEKLSTLMDDKFLNKDEKQCLYIYRQVKGNHVFTSIIGLASMDEYRSNHIKKHELTLLEKESEIASFFKRVRINGSPVLLTYPPNPKLEWKIRSLLGIAPAYHFIEEDNIEHFVWKISDENDVQAICEYFSGIESLYIADGHHRCAALCSLYPDVDSFMACFIPSDQVSIHGFHRYIKDFNGLSLKEFITALEQEFVVTKSHLKEPLPTQSVIHFFAEREWYTISIPPSLKTNANPKHNLDVFILDNYIFGKILGVNDTRSSEKVRFINGDVSNKSLLSPVLSNEMKALFMLYPVHVEDVIRVSDYDETMPPKSTWIEPKLRAGLLIHSF